MVTSILTYNLEVAFNLRQSEIKSIDKIDLMLLKNALKTSSKVSRCLILLDLGLVSAEYIIKQKRANYLHTLLNSEASSISKKVFDEQLKSPIKGDFVNYIKEDLKEIGIQLSFEEIGSMSKSKWKVLVKNKIKEACFISLSKQKEKLSKGKECKYDKLELQSYFKSGNTLATDTKRKIFKTRSRDLYLKCNFPNAFSDLQCVTGCDENSRDDQQHLFSCSVLSGNTIMSDNIRYEDIFNQNDVLKQQQVVNILYKHLEKRNKFVSPDCDMSGPLDPRYYRATRPCLVIPEERRKRRMQRLKRTT